MRKKMERVQLFCPTRKSIKSILDTWLYELSTLGITTSFYHSAKRWRTNHSWCLFCKFATNLINQKVGKKSGRCLLSDPNKKANNSISWDSSLMFCIQLLRPILPSCST